MPAMSDMRTPQQLTELKHIHEQYEQDYAKYVAKLLAHKTRFHIANRKTYKGV